MRRHLKETSPTLLCQSSYNKSIFVNTLCWLTTVLVEIIGAVTVEVVPQTWCRNRIPHPTARMRSLARGHVG
ncbi:hypothetical protein FFI94_032010 [Rhodococcus sp. KBS0724]|uniref:hypothetical protein n=1 Tax=Rhodococcus sp. KBS0724 TaxID=1179674 RepID=UPI00110E6BD4|nr:hypothetical protein [Rhodococcus sp. KBS0724]TSD40357.1 hypothetical protein FFI94_032010 [Rhodococcus sp. KBS0724]